MNGHRAEAGWVLPVMLLLASLVPGMGRAQTAQRRSEPVQTPWRIQGHSHLDFDQYGSRGDPGGSLFTDTGNHLYEEGALSISHEVSDLDRWQLEAGGILNNSRYRSPDWGGELEKFRYSREKGDTSLPYRLEVGEFYGNFSYRTLMKPLKGVQLELQPDQGDRSRQSIIVALGLADRDWKDLSRDQDRTAGISWLRQGSDDSRISLNLVLNDRDPDSGIGRPRLGQVVYSLGYERMLRIFGERAVWENEAAWFAGELDRAAGPATTQPGRRLDTGMYSALSSEGGPVSYRLRFERHGQDFRPAGGNLAPGRKTVEGFLTWKSPRHRTATVRVQQYEDTFESPNPLRTRVMGIRWKGPLEPGRNLQAGLDAFIETRADRRTTVKTMVKAIAGDLSQPISSRLTGRLGASFRSHDDRLTTLGDNRISQVSLEVDQALEFAGLPGRLGVNLENRQLDEGGIKRREWTPALILALARHGHDVELHYRLQRQDRMPDGLLDVDSADSGFRYRFHRGDTTLGVELLRNDRSDSTGLWSKSSRINAFCHTAFDDFPGADPR